MKARLLVLAALLALVAAASLAALYGTPAAGQVAATVIPRDTLHRPVRLAFLTSQHYPANFGGVAAANAFCNSDPARPLKSVKYRAYALADPNDPLTSDWHLATDKLLFDEGWGTHELWTAGTPLTLFSGSFWVRGNCVGCGCANWTSTSSSLFAYAGTGLDQFGSPQGFSITCNAGPQSLLCVEWYE